MSARRKFNAHVKRKVAADAGWRCDMCNELLDETYELDHKIALWKGGEDAVHNLRPLHAACHRKKTLEEEIERLALREQCGERSRTLTCSKCQHVVSPYFLHKCKTTDY